MTPHTIIGDKSKTAADAAISAVRMSIRDWGKGAQVVHIIIANLILTNNQWQAIVSVITEKEVDDTPNDIITFGHLPAKYDDLYDDLLPEVDNLNIIDDDSIWQNIKTYLLDIYFYQAVNFKKLERIKETGGGYFKEAEKANDTDPETITLLHELPLEIKHPAKDTNNKLFDASFYKAAQSTELKVLYDFDEVFLKKQRSKLLFGELKIS